MNYFRLMAGLMVCLTVALVFTACRQNVPVTNNQVSAALKQDGDFVGNAGCVECHKKEFEEHKGTRHDITLRPVTRESLGEVAPPVGTVPLAGYVLEEQNGDFRITRQLPQPESLKLDLALGSGKSGMTYVSLLNKKKLMETRMSYFPPFKRWEVTPGQENRLATDKPFGREQSGQIARKCLGCHVVTLPADALTPDPKFYGVGCETCHGPGRAHIAAVRAGEKVNHLMADLRQLRSKQLNDLCGKCHRSLDEVDVSSPEASQTQRFQAFALFRSKCRLRNGQTLSCLSCHDPHRNASTDHRSYEAVCLSCHDTNASKQASAHSNVGNGKPCPVNAKTDCIRCHMPPRPAFPGIANPAKMADHFIAKPRKGQISPPPFS